MKVLYDISVLGIGETDPSARTGIYRVVETIAEHLALHKDCDLQFCATYDETALEYSLKYLQKKKEFSEIHFSKPLSLLAAEAKKKRFDLLDQFFNSEMSIPKKIATKVKVHTLHTKERLLRRLGKDYLIREKDLAKTDIFHSTFIPINQQVKKSKAKAFITCYDLIPVLHPQFSVEAIRNVFKDILKSIDRETWVPCISHATRNDLLNYMGSAVDPDKVIVTELAASDNFYPSLDKALNKKVREYYKIPDVPYIISVCTLEPRKNIDQAIRAFIQIIEQEKIPDLNLVLVGAKGWMFDKIFEELDANKALKDRIIITGYVANEHLAPLYSDALLFVYPSFYEGFGLPPLEAMQCGTPVITSNTSSLPEVVGDAGIMVKPTDLNELCEAMLSVYKNPSFRDVMKQKSINRAGRFSWERCTHETVNAYKAALS